MKRIFVNLSCLKEVNVVLSVCLFFVSFDPFKAVNKLSILITVIMIIIIIIIIIIATTITINFMCDTSSLKTNKIVALIKFCFTYF